MAIRTRSSRSIHIDLPIDACFELFKPKGEERWVPDWRPVDVHPSSGETQRGQVFVTGSADERTLWTVIDHDPQARSAEWVTIARVSDFSRGGWPTSSTIGQPSISHVDGAVPSVRARRAKGRTSAGPIFGKSTATMRFAYQPSHLCSGFGGSVSSHRMSKTSCTLGSSNGGRSMSSWIGSAVATACPRDCRWVKSTAPG